MARSWASLCRDRRCARAWRAFASCGLGASVGALADWIRRLSGLDGTDGPQSVRWTRWAWSVSSRPSGFVRAHSVEDRRYGVKIGNGLESARGQIAAHASRHPLRLFFTATPCFFLPFRVTDTVRSISPDPTGDANPRPAFYTTDPHVITYQRMPPRAGLIWFPAT